MKIKLAWEKYEISGLILPSFYIIHCTWVELGYLLITCKAKHTLSVCFPFNTRYDRCHMENS